VNRVSFSLRVAPETTGAVSRQECGDRSTESDCPQPAAACRHRPGTLIAGDLPHQIPAEIGLLHPAELHLGAVAGILLGRISSAIGVDGEQP
jgi:hypothetical protein